MPDHLGSMLMYINPGVWSLVLHIVLVVIAGSWIFFRDVFKFLRRCIRLDHKSPGEQSDGPVDSSGGAG